MILEVAPDATLPGRRRNLPEPEWYRMITVVARCEDAERWRTSLSRPYPRYSRRETARQAAAGVQRKSARP